VVDLQYRLSPADLAGKPRQVLVHHVGLQGVEELTPLLYFEGVSRPLALDPDQLVEMSRIARSHILTDWVGAALVLRPVREQGRETIRLFDLEERTRAWSPAIGPGWSAPASRRGAMVTRTLVLLLVLAIAFTAVSMIDSLPDLTQWTGQFIP
jgi:hypothetical protein